MKNRLLSLILLLLSLPAHSQWFEKEFEVMGTIARVEFETESEQKAQLLITDVIDEMNRVDQLMSPFKTTSELSKLNQQAAKHPVQISDELYRLLQRSAYYSNLTQGAFDITFSSVGYLYDYRNNKKPTKAQKESLVSSINYKSVKLSNQLSSVKQSIVQFKNPNTKIDLGGIAKGHAVDQCIKLLQKSGIKNAFISAGGDSRVIGRKNGRLWYIGIRHPRNKDKLIVNLPLENTSISTSGDYERFFIQDNIRYHHIIDPKTGDSSRNSQSVTILAENSVDADALSTSIFVLGPVKGMALVNTLPNVSAIIVDINGKMTVSDDLVNAN